MIVFLVLPVVCIYMFHRCVCVCCQWRS